MTKRSCIYKWETLNYDKRVVMLEGMCWFETWWKHWSTLDNIIKYFYYIYIWDQWVESKSVVNEVKLTYENFSTIRDKCLLISHSFCSVVLDYLSGGKLITLYKKAYFSGHRATEFLKWKWLWEYPKRLLSQYTTDYTVMKTAGHICATRFSYNFKMKHNFASNDTKPGQTPCKLFFLPLLV